MSATNAHRLGANEAPPAIISIFLGSQLSGILDKIEEMSAEDLINLSAKEGMKLNLTQIPEIMFDSTDRNRTSPFAFTGNRFEFRAVGSSANCASAMIALNAAMAAQLQDFAAKVDARVASGEQLKRVILDETKALISAHRTICFDGNGYSEEWKAEAAARGLDCNTNAATIFDAYLSPKSVEMFRNTGVFSKVELAARNEVKWEMYTKKIQIEARVLGDLALNHVLPVAIRYQSILLDNIAKMKALFPADQANEMSRGEMETVAKIARHTATIKTETEKMVDARRRANKLDSEREKAIAYHDTVVPCMDTIRYHIDKLELMVDNQMWPLPKYRELLFIR